MSHWQLLSHRVTQQYVGLRSYFLVLSAKLYFEEGVSVCGCVCVCTCVHTHRHPHTLAYKLCGC